ncbi:MAG: dTMP kinase [Hyphomicrobiales bacterium]|nr:dTMP kinase [Hyphomicrobiales bacterium]
MATSRKKRGFFVTFEGGEGSGKSSQINLLADELNAIDEKVVITREPGGSTGGEAVRHVLLSGAAESFGSEMEAILFFAARSDNVETIIKPALEKGNHVLCDRFFDSTRVYQGASGNANVELLNSLERVICEDVWPDLTIVIDLDPREGLARAAKRRGKNAEPDRFEKETLALQDERRKSYLALAQKEPERCVIVDGLGTSKEVSNRIRKVIQERLGLFKPVYKGEISGSIILSKKSSKTSAGKGSASNG